MHTVVVSLVALISLQHFGFLILEMFFYTKPIGLKIFRISKDHALATSALAANQGLYNGFLAMGLLLSLCDPAIAFDAQVYFLICIAIAGLYGGYSVHKKIWAIQMIPALLTLALVVTF